MWMTVAGVRAGRHSGPATALLVNRTRSAVLPIAVDDDTAVDVATAYCSGFSAGGNDLLLTVVAALGARIHYIALAGRTDSGSVSSGGGDTSPAGDGCTPPSPAARRSREPRPAGGFARAPRLRLDELSATLVLTDDHRVRLTPREALVVATRAGTPFDVASPLRTRIVPVEPGVTGALAKNVIEDAVDELRGLLDRARPSDFGHTA